MQSAWNLQGSWRRVKTVTEYGELVQFKFKEWNSFIWILHYYMWCSCVVGSTFILSWLLFAELEFEVRLTTVENTYVACRTRVPGRVVTQSWHCSAHGLQQTSNIPISCICCLQIVPFHSPFNSNIFPQLLGSLKQVSNKKKHQKSSSTQWVQNQNHFFPIIFLVFMFIIQPVISPSNFKISTQISLPNCWGWKKECLGVKGTSF